MDKNMLKMLTIKRRMRKEKVKRVCAKQSKSFLRTENVPHW